VPGSRKGIPNRATAAREKAIRESGVTPLEFLLDVMRTEPTIPDSFEGLTKKEFADCVKACALTLEMQIDAAKAAAPYVHPKLVATEMKVSGTLISEIQNRIIDHGPHS
jgi:hypothetical protein